ncbi:hypothetical protein [Shewanella glacialipiscicola]|uniref:hypothetical protein n=1 Tax=Shewanella glacialipiscicola TaxID=614069 RepID=UPI003D79FE96
MKPTIVRLNLRTLMNDLDLSDNSFTLNSPLIESLQNLEDEGFIIDGTDCVFGLKIDALGKEDRNMKPNAIYITEKFVRQINNK